MDLKFYSELADDCPANVDTEFMDTQPYGGYSEENKVTLHPRMPGYKPSLLYCS